MSITVLNYMDHALVSRINEQAAKRAEAAKQSNTDDFAAALADSTKALENSQNTSQTGTTGADTSGISAAQTTASSANSYTSGELDSIFEEAANSYGVSSIILKSIANAASGFNPSAVSRKYHGRCKIYQPVIIQLSGKYLPCARRLQCRQRECGQIRRHPAFYRDTELRQKSTLLYGRIWFCCFKYRIFCFRSAFFYFQSDRKC